MLPAALSSVLLRDASGRERALADVAGLNTAVVLVFLRHFACPSCSDTAHRLAARAHEIDALGCGLVVIGSGSVDALRGFEERLGFSRAVVALTDPSLAAHQAAGMVRSKWATFGPRAIARSLSLYAAGHYAKRRADDGDLDQQGGVLVFSRDGLIFEHRNHFVGDDVEPNEIVAALLVSEASRAEVRT